MAFYNEIDPFAAQWLRNLQGTGLIEAGPVDERSIKDLRASDLTGHGRAHFFAGIAGWDYALQLAGWPGERPVWTGSCPCQPFSSAGKRQGFSDERHLWPEFYRLIGECRPPTIFGEQVASRAGREWLARVFADLEGLGYAVAGADLCAAGLGAPHIRQRLWWVALAQGPKRERLRPVKNRSQGGPPNSQWLGDTRKPGLAGWTGEPGNDGPQREAAQRAGGDALRLEHPKGDRRDERGTESGGRGAPGGCGEGGMGDTERSGRHGPRVSAQRGSDLSVSAWAGATWLPCADGKARRVEPRICPLAHGVPGRVGQLRAYGNAIVPFVAAEFIRAFMECAAGAKEGDR